jgi:acetylglutamate kinase
MFEEQTIQEAKLSLKQACENGDIKKVKEMIDANRRRINFKVLINEVNRFSVVCELFCYLH